MFSRIIRTFDQRIGDWVARRIPPSAQKTLTHREIFVLPTRWGLMFGGMVVLILITGINYQNSMILAVGLFLISVSLLSIVLTYRNLAGLSLTFHRGQPCYAGELAGFEFVATAPGSRYTNIEMGWVPDQFASANIAEQSQSNIFIECKTRHRGVFRPGRMLLTTTYPFGLIRAWSWQDMLAEAIVYPAPVQNDQFWGSIESETDKDGVQSELPGQEDFAGLRTYIPGESLSRVAWKKYARTGELFTKEFTRPAADPEWVDFNAFQMADTELKLSCMCGQLQQLHEQGKPFGLRMPGLSLPPQLGPLHFQQCLTALAMYPHHAAKKL